MPDEALHGNDFVLRKRVSEDPDVFQEVSANTSLSKAINGEEVNVSTKDGNGWRQLLRGGGEKSVSISGEGIYTAATHQKAMAALARSGELELFQVDDGDEVLEGLFQVTSFEQSGDLNQGQTYSTGLESADEPTVT